MYRECGVVRTNAYGTFTARPSQLKWFATMPGNVYVSLEYFVWLDPSSSETLRDFGGLDSLLEFYVGWHDRRWLHMEPRSAEARIGPTSIVRQYQFNAADYFAREDARSLFANDGDLSLSLRDAHGAELQNMNIPRTYLIAVEQELRDITREVRENVADKEHRCPLVPEEEIVVT